MVSNLPYACRGNATPARPPQPHAPPPNPQDALRDLQRRLPSLRGRDRGLGHRDVARAAAALRQARAAMMADILRGADVICSTCVGAGRCAGVVAGLLALDRERGAVVCVFSNGGGDRTRCCWGDAHGWRCLPLFTLTQPERTQ